MTKPCDETLEREKNKLWLSDAELIRRLGVPEDKARAALRELDKPGSGFPKKVKLWDDRRWWPAVKEYFDKVYGCSIGLPARRNADRQAQNRGGARSYMAAPEGRMGGHLASPRRSGGAGLLPQKPALVGGRDTDRD